MKIRQEIAGIVTAMVCTASLLCMNTSSLIAEADTEGTYEVLTYNTLDSDEDGTDDYVSITYCDTSATEVVIPEEIEGLPVTSIGYYAFRDCESLTSITIPDSVTSIGDSAFEYCTSLASITIPDSVTSIGSYAFSNTALLANQTGVKYADTWVVDCDEDVTFAEIKDGTRGVAASTFYYCTSLASITIPDSVTSIGDSAFAYCTSFASITIPDSVTSIGNSAFYECTSLASITIPYSVTSIEGVAFGNCASLASITIPDSVTSIEYYAFGNCTSLASITIPDSVTSIGDSAFAYCTSLASITIPDSVTSIGVGAFENCTSLASITIPDSVTSIGDGAFENCTSLASITILNPECEIYDCSNTIINGTDENYNDYFNGTIYGYANSTAQEYAEKYNRTFVALDSEQPTETIDPSLVTKYGDLNNDGDVSVSDVVKLNLYLLNKTENPLDAVALANADCVRDGIIDSSDSSLIMNYIAMMVDYDKLGTL